MSDTCVHCGASFQSKALMAIMADMGASVHPDPDYCPESESGNHKFEDG